MHKQPTLNIQTFIIFQLYEELKTEYILKITDFTRDSSWLYMWIEYQPVYLFP